LALIGGREGVGLLWAESWWNRIHAYRELPILVKELEIAVVKGIPGSPRQRGMIGVNQVAGFN
jgi:hypothetical protein